MPRPNSFLRWLKSYINAKERQQIDDACREAAELEAIAGLRAGRRDALDWFIVQYGLAVWYLCRWILGDEQDAEEAWADTYEKLWRGFETWDPTRGSLRSWLLTVARNAATDVGRRTGRHERHRFRPDDENRDPLAQYIDTAPGPDRLIEGFEFRQIVEDALPGIGNSNHRVAFALRHLEQLSIGDVANALDAHPAMVRVWLWRARQTLQRVLASFRPTDRAGDVPTDPPDVRAHATTGQSDDERSEVVPGDTTTQASADVPPSDAGRHPDDKSEVVGDGDSLDDVTTPDTDDALADDKSEVTGDDDSLDDVTTPDTDDALEAVEHERENE